MEQKAFADGEVIFSEGDSGEEAFLVATGSVEISRNVDGEGQVLGTIEAGHLFGEMALISDKPRTATATAKGNTVCFLVPKLVFQAELDGSSALMKSLVINLISHVRSLMERLEAGEEEDETPGVIFHYPSDHKTYTRGE